MSRRPPPDWDPRSPSVLEDQGAAYDEMRARCPVAYSAYLHWSVFRHADAKRLLEEHETFSNAVSSHLSVPNGMDPPEHGRYRAIVDRYFEPPRMQAFAPVCREIAGRLAGDLPTRREVDLMGEFAEPFAVEVQCAFMGWPNALHEPLSRWVRKNQEATLAGHQATMAAVALEFDHYIREQLDLRRRAGAAAADDVTAGLLREQVDGRPLRDDEIVSIVRNWTVGELGTIAASIGILVHYLAERPPLQQQLREQPSLLPAATDEILRIHAPLIASRRVTTRGVEMGGRAIEAGERLSLIWASANRDEAVFGDPDAFRPDRDPSLNLLYGAGIHVCPGAPLARLELRIVLEELLARTRQIALAPGTSPARARYPASGFSRLPVWIA